MKESFSVQTKKIIETMFSRYFELSRHFSLDVHIKSGL